MITFPELKEILKQENVIDLVERFNITSEDIVEAFWYKVDEHYDDLVTEFDQDDNDSDES